jgi:Domain of unknown function (DUF6980)
MCDIANVEYHEVFPMDRAELERLLESGNEKAIVDALLSAASYDPDWRWVQGICLRFLDHPAKWVRWNAATGLGYVARIHKSLDTEVVLPKLIALRADAEIASHVEDALDDINGTCGLIRLEQRSRERGMNKHCCDRMEYDLNQKCDMHPDRSDCPDALITFVRQPWRF